MAARYYANTEIQFGKADDEGVQTEVVVIKENEEVKGLPKEVMADLWAAGALRAEGGDATDPRIEAARHASKTGEGVDNELTNPDSKKSQGTPAKSTTPTASGVGADAGAKTPAGGQK